MPEESPVRVGKNQKKSGGPLPLAGQVAAIREILVRAKLVSASEFEDLVEASGLNDI